MEKLGYFLCQHLVTLISTEALLLRQMRFGQLLIPGRAPAVGLIFRSSINYENIFCKIFYKWNRFYFFLEMTKHMQLKTFTLESMTSTNCWVHCELSAPWYWMFQFIWQFLTNQRALFQSRPRVITSELQGIMPWLLDRLK